MDVERIIDEIEQLQEMFEAPDIRPLSASDISVANRRHDEMLAHSPWFRLWHTRQSGGAFSPIVSAYVASKFGWTSALTLAAIVTMGSGLCWLGAGATKELVNMEGLVGKSS